MTTARLYTGLIRAELSAAAAYRLGLVLGVFGWASPLAFLVLWHGASRGSAVEGIGPDRLAAYFCLLLVTNTLQLTFPVIFGFGHLVYSGELSALLLRPQHPLHATIARAVATNLYQVPTLAILVPVALVVSGASLTRDPAAWVVGIAVALLGAVANLHLAAMSAAVAFWMSKAQGIQGLLVAAEWVLGGVVAPAALLPPGLAAVVVHQPLWFAIGAGPALLAGIDVPSWWVLAEAAGWCLVLHLGYRVLWRHALRRYEAVGT